MSRLSIVPEPTSQDHSAQHTPGTKTLWATFQPKVEEYCRANKMVLTKFGKRYVSAHSLHDTPFAIMDLEAGTVTLFSPEGLINLARWFKLIDKDTIISHPAKLTCQQSRMCP